MLELNYFYKKNCLIYIYIKKNIYIIKKEYI